jgi:Flp pilus assembly protein TadB
MTSGDRAGVGCLGSVLSALVFLVGLAVFLVVLVLVAGVFMAAIVVALVALGIHRLMLALSPRYRDRRRAHGAFQPTTRVIETTARVIDSTKPKRPE